MTNIWCIGRKYENLLTNVAVATSVDGQIWNIIGNPFLPRESGHSICYHNSALVALGDNGQISYTNDFSTWSKGDIGVDGMCIMGSISTDKIVACGRRHYVREQDGYDAAEETAQIFKSTTGEPGTWAMIFSSGSTPSGFNNIKYFPIADIGNSILQPICVVVGDKQDNPYALYSTDLGETWKEIPIDKDLYDPFFDVEYNKTTKKWYFATGGTIAIATNLISPSWTSTELFDINNSAVNKIKFNPQGEMVAINQDTIWFSSNGESWTTFTAQGYWWRSVTWFDDKWIVGAESLLTQHTFWTSTDGINWKPDNNNVQMLAFTTNS